MVALFAVLLAAAAVPPQPGDDDPKERSAGRVAALPARDEDDASKPNPTAKRTLSSKASDAEDDEDDEEGHAQPETAIVVTARKLDAARTQIVAELGSTVYSLTNDAIENRPGGETGSIAQILAQAPGVTLAGNGLTVRGSPANQVRINNVIIPEAISDPADHLSSRLAETTRLVTGTLPAQFGFAPAGVISVTTKNGLYEHGGQAELFAGTDGMVEPALEWSGSMAGTSLFATGSFERDRSMVADAQGIEAHDRRNELEGLGFADHVIDESNRVSVVFGGSHERHEFGPTTIGMGTERNGDGYAVTTFQHSGNHFTVQASLFGGFASRAAEFTGRTRERRGTFGTQIDASHELGETHTLRFGLLAGRSTEHDLETSAAQSRYARTAAAVYVQDEWKITPSLTFNPGARVEWLRGFGSAAKPEPRASLVWRSAGGLTAHAGYARFASAIPLGEGSARGLPDERDDYFDAGLQQQAGALTIGLDGYARHVRNYIAERQRVGSALPSAFEFRRAHLDGVELSATYARGPMTAWANVALSKAKGRTIMAGATLFPAETIAAASARWIPLAGDRPITGSGGLTWRFGKLDLAGDLSVSSGAVKTPVPDEPNGARYPTFAEFGLAAVYHVRIADRPADLRLDLTNLTDVRAYTNDASNLEGDWTRHSRGRAVTFGIEQGF